MTKKRYRKLMMAVAADWIQMGKASGHYRNSDSIYRRDITPDFTVFSSYQEAWDKTRPLFETVFGKEN